MAGAQAVEFRQPLALGKGTGAAYRFIRQHVKPLVEDRPLQYDINTLGGSSGPASCSRPSKPRLERWNRSAWC